MSQTISITIDGNDGVVPDSLASVMDSVFAILHSLEKQSWPLDAMRMKWRVTEAKLVNPLTITSTGDEIMPTNKILPVFPVRLVEGLAQIEGGVWPHGFTDSDVRHAKTIGREWKENRRVTIDGRNGSVEQSFTVSRTFFRQATKLLRQPKVISREYGSIDGALIQLANDPLKPDATAKIRDRFNNIEVFCHAEPTVATRLAVNLNRETRVVVYGTITFENGIAHRIDVEDFATVPTDDKLATLDDLHALNLRMPDEMSVEDYLDDLRGDE